MTLQNSSLHRWQILMHLSLKNAFTRAVRCVGSPIYIYALALLVSLPTAAGRAPLVASFTPSVGRVKGTELLERWGKIVGRDSGYQAELAGSTDRRWDCLQCDDATYISGEEESEKLRGGQGPAFVSAHPPEVCAELSVGSSPVKMRRMDAFETLHASAEKCKLRARDGVGALQDHVDLSMESSKVRPREQKDVFQSAQKKAMCGGNMHAFQENKALHELCMDSSTMPVIEQIEAFHANRKDSRSLPLIAPHGERDGAASPLSADDLVTHEALGKVEKRVEGFTSRDRSVWKCACACGGKGGWERVGGRGRFVLKEMRTVLRFV